MSSIIISIFGNKKWTAKYLYIEIDGKKGGGGVKK